MVRIAGVDIPNEKRLAVSLTYIHGIGPTLSQRILGEAAVSADVRARDLTDEETTRLREIIDRGYVVEGELRRQVNMNIMRLTEIGCYRGLRHRRGLPVRGQRTRTNSRTKRGRRRTVAGRRRTVAKK